MKNATLGLALLLGLCVAPGTAAYAYDGTNCKAPGNCWEPKPGFPDKIAGSKYDPKHDPKEIAKQQTSIEGMEARNKKRVAYFNKTGKWIYDVDKIPADPVSAAPTTPAPAPALRDPAEWATPSR